MHKSKNIMIRRIILYIGVITLILASCSKSADENSGASYKPDDEILSIAVEAMTVTKNLLINEIRGAGIAEGIREAWVVSETEGLIRDVRFSLGDRVLNDEALVTVDNNLAARNKDLAIQQYETALLEFQAAERSRDSGSISQLQYSQITDRLLAADASRAAAMKNYENTILRAPFAGAVASKDRDISIGNYLSRGIRVARIVDDSAFRTEISVGEGQILKINEGTTAEITGNDGIKRLGNVAAISAGSDGSTGSYTVVVEWTPEKGDRLRSGMSVEVSIKVDGEQKRIIIPDSAIRVRGGINFVFVEEAGFAESREVSLGNRLGDRVEILNGLEEGDLILTSGRASLTPGIPVKITLVGKSGDE